MDQYPLDYDIPYFDFKPATRDEVRAAIMRSASKTWGIDGLTAPMLKASVDAVLDPITAIINSSLNTSQFPEAWKRTLILPLSKTKIPASPSETRPIARLSELSKVLERIVHGQLSAFLEENFILDPRQAGFRRGHSTQTALIGVLDDVREAIEHGMLTILILFDFSKAFDSIPHSKLIRKLRRINISSRALRWFFNYLADRLQAVIDEGGSISEWLSAASGVPQGSVLGPLLFAVYINDLPAVLRFSKYLIFADDTQIYHHCLFSRLISDGIPMITADAQAISDYAKDNGLNLNMAKTKAMIMGSELYISRLDLSTLPAITVDGVPIPYVSEAKNLGVWITQTLDWQPHVKQIARQVHSTLRTLRFYRHAMPRGLRKSLVESLVFPRFDYACAVYHNVDTTRETKLKRLLNACVRFVVGNIGFREHVTPHRLELCWLQPRRRREYFLATLAFKVLTTCIPTYIHARFTLTSSQPDLRRSARNRPRALLYPNMRTEAWKQAFFIQASMLLNSLGISDFSVSIATFKELIFNKLAKLDKDEWNALMTVSISSRL